MMNKKQLSIIATLALSAACAHATLVGSLHIDANIDTNNVDSISGLATRTGNGDENTQGTVEGAFSFLAAYTNGHSSGYLGMDIDTFSGATRFNNMDRYNGGPPTGILVWDFDLSGQSATNAWIFKVDCDTRRDADTVPDEWFISFNGMDRTLDTTDITTLTARDGVGYSKVTDLGKYVKIGDLPAGEAAGVYTWDLTEIVQAAITNGGSVRLVYSCDGYYDDIRFINDSGLISTNVSSGMDVFIPKILVADVFETGTGSATNNGAIANGWISVHGPEQKEYNVGSSGILDIRDAFLGSAPEEGTNAVHNGEFESVQIQFDPLQLANVGDWLEMSVDIGCYQDTSGAPLADVGQPMANLSLADSARTNEAGWGFFIRGPSSPLFSSLRSYNGALGYPQEIVGFKTSRTAVTTNAPLQTWRLRITRIEGDTYQLIPSLDGVRFDTTKNWIGTNATCLGAAFDTLTISARQKDVGIKIDNMSIATNVKLTQYEKWALGAGLDSGNNNPTNNPDSDVYNNWGEYVFGGNPLVPDTGIQPKYNAVGGYVYTVRNDPDLTPSILTSADLMTGLWTTNAADPITLDDGGLNAYTNSVGSGAGEQFYKLLVE